MLKSNAVVVHKFCESLKDGTAFPASPAHKTWAGRYCSFVACLQFIRVSRSSVPSVRALIGLRVRNALRLAMVVRRFFATVIRNRNSFTLRARTTKSSESRSRASVSPNHNRSG